MISLNHPRRRQTAPSRMNLGRPVVVPETLITATVGAFVALIRRGHGVAVRIIAGVRALPIGHTILILVFAFNFTTATQVYKLLLNHLRIYKYKLNKLKEKPLFLCPSSNFHVSMHADADIFIVSIITPIIFIIANGVCTIFTS